MNAEAIRFLSFTLLAIVVQGVFALFEMACISFNKVRLQYEVALGKKRALWLKFLLNRPSRLFGTTLIGVNVALQIGSECSRRFYESMHLDPDWAPLTQIFIVVIFAELAPLFAARRHPEQFAMFFVPIMVFLSRLLSPFILGFDALSRMVHRLMGKSEEVPLFLSREEVRMAFEEPEKNEFNEALGRIFQLKNMNAKELMTPLSKVQAVPSQATVAEIRSLLSVHYAPLIPIYHRTSTNIVAIASLRDLLHLEEHQRALEHARSPWFITQDTSILQILDQFRRNSQSVAVILNSFGQACGLLSLDQILTQIFGEEREGGKSLEGIGFHIERTLPGEMLVSDFNLQFRADLPIQQEGETLNDLLLREIEHPPVKGETVYIGSFIFRVLEATLLGAKTLSVHTLQE